MAMYYILEITNFGRAGAGNQTFASIAELALYDALGNNVARLDGCSYMASSNASGEHVSAAFDGRSDTFWQSDYSGAPNTTNWIQVRTPSDAKVVSFGITPRDGTLYDAPYSFKLFSLPDGGEEPEPIFEQTNLTDGWTPGVERRFNIVPLHYNKVMAPALPVMSGYNYALIFKLDGIYKLWLCKGKMYYNVSANQITQSAGSNGTVEYHLESGDWVLKGTGNWATGYNEIIWSNYDVPFNSAGSNDIFMYGTSPSLKEGIYHLYKLVITNFGRSGTPNQLFANLAEFALYDSSGDNIARVSGCSYKCSSEVSSNPLSAAFDGNPDTCWHSNWASAYQNTTNWLQVYTPSESNAVSFSITPQPSGGYSDFPYDFVLLASHNGVTWYPIYEQAYLTSGWSLGVERKFIIEDNEVQYSYNGFLAPRIPEVTHSPYAVIFKESSGYSLLFCYGKIYYKSDGNNLSQLSGNLVIYNLRSGEWRFANAGHWATGSIIAVVWANYDVPLNSPTGTEIYHYAGEPLVDSPNVPNYKISGDALNKLANELRRISGVSAQLTPGQMIALLKS